MSKSYKITSRALCREIHLTPDFPSSLDSALSLYGEEMVFALYHDALTAQWRKTVTEALKSSNKTEADVYAISCSFVPQMPGTRKRKVPTRELNVIADHIEQGELSLEDLQDIIDQKSQTDEKDGEA